MTREIKASEAVISVEKSFDGKHEIQFNEKSHRYKLDGKPCPGVTTVLKASMPTSIGLMNWMKSQSVEALFKELTQYDFAQPVWLPNSDKFPITLERKKELFKAATTAHEEIAQEAADIGTITHTYAELYSLGKADEASELLEKVKKADKFPIIKVCIGKYLEWTKDNKGEFVSAELLVASPTYDYCGKYDRIDRVNGKLRLRDYKTSKSIYIDQFVQLAAYRLAIKEWLNLEIEGLEIVRFGKEDGAFETLVIDKPEEIQVFTDQAIRCRQTYDFMKLNNDPRFDWKKR